MSSTVQQTGSGRMMRQAGVVGFFTLMSRFFGLARVSAIAYLLGTSAAADAFYVAFRIPNLFRRMFAEGNLTLSFVPVFTESLHRSFKEAKQVVDVTATLMSLILLVLCVLGVWGAPWLVHLVAWGFEEGTPKFELTVQLARITFPFLLLVSLSALMMGVLNARKHFAAPAAAPIMLNVGMIVGALVLAPHFSQPAEGVAWGVLLGGLLQWVIQVPVLAKHGFFPKPDFHFRLPALGKIARLMGPTLYGSAVYQINLLAMTLMASFLPTGSVSYIEYADRVMEFPLGVFAVTLATVALPKFSDHGAQGQHEEVSKTLRQVLSMAWLLTIPAAVGLGVLAEPVLSLLFYRGDFTLESTYNTSKSLHFFVLGLPFIAAARISTGAFYSVQEARKPVRAANFSVLVTLLSGLILLKPLGFRGLALAVSLGGLANFLFLMIYYRQHVGPLGLGKLLGNVGKIILAALIMGVALGVLKHFWDQSFAEFWTRLFYVLAMVGIGAVLYLILAFALRVDGLREVWQTLSRQLRIKRD